MWVKDMIDEVSKSFREVSGGSYVRVVDYTVSFLKVDICLGIDCEVVENFLCYNKQQWVLLTIREILFKLVDFFLTLLCLDHITTLDSR